MITQKELASFEKRYRTNLINSLSGFKSANLIGTKSKAGLTNLSIFSSAVHLGADPALIGLIQRPASVERHTYENIVETGCFTVNHVNEEIFKQAHQTSARYLREESEFTATGLTEEYVMNFYAPFVKESVIRFACVLKEEIPVRLNNTIMLVGEIQFIEANEKWITSDGHLLLEEAGTVSVSGLDHYHRSSDLGRLPYAKRV